MEVTHIYIQNCNSKRSNGNTCISNCFQLNVSSFYSVREFLLKVEIPKLH